MDTTGDKVGVYKMLKKDTALNGNGELLFTGIFLAWGVEYSLSIALVKDDDGRVHKVYPDSLRFINN